MVAVQGQTENHGRPNERQPAPPRPNWPSTQARSGAGPRATQGRTTEAGYPTHKECAVTPEKTNREQSPKDRAERAGRRRTEKLGSLDVWARSAPIRLAG